MDLEVVVAALKLNHSKALMLFLRPRAWMLEAAADVVVVVEAPLEDEVRREVAVVLLLRLRRNLLRYMREGYSGFELCVLGLMTYDHADEWALFESQCCMIESLHGTWMNRENSRKEGLFL
jgi:hypothetical protein